VNDGIAIVGRDLAVFGWSCRTVGSPRRLTIVSAVGTTGEARQCRCQGAGRPTSTIRTEVQVCPPRSPQLANRVRPRQNCTPPRRDRGQNRVDLRAQSLAALGFNSSLAPCWTTRP
jgi:hypothetical protein